jgi:Cu/Zn superoxide dismutase
MWTALRFAALVVLTVLLLAPTVGSAAEVKITLNPQNNSGESGTATLTDSGDGKTKVEVQVNGQPGGPQPMHIHKGTCAKLDPAPAYGLPAVTGGKAESTVNVSLADLQKGEYAINGHKSPQEASVYVFCGEIPKQ